MSDDHNPSTRCKGLKMRCRAPILPKQPQLRAARPSRSPRLAPVPPPDLHQLDEQARDRQLAADSKLAKRVCSGVFIRSSCSRNRRRIGRPASTSTHLPSPSTCPSLAPRPGLCVRTWPRCYCMKLRPTIEMLTETEWVLSDLARLCWCSLLLPHRTDMRCGCAHGA